MGLSEMGRDITEHENVNLVFPESTEMILHEDSIQGAILDDVFALVFPQGKLMWPIYKAGTHSYTRGKAVRSVKTAQYSPMRIFTICADHRGAWVFVRHETSNENLAGFIATLDGTLVQGFGNVEPVEITQWIMQVMNQK